MPAESIDCTDRYCIIGAGPAGLAMAHALRQLGVPYDQFERHSAVGGLWDIENPGSPMYESAHLISSKTMSGFIGFPMPADYPDYPTHDKVLAYLRAFARAGDLESGITFGRSVDRIDPEAKTATVTLGSDRRTYRGVICATGTNWHPALPDWAEASSFELRHVRDYRSPDELRGKRVLVVGLGNSGADIACDAARVAKSAWVSIRRGYHFVPKHIFGMPVDVFAHDGPRLPLWLEAPVFGILLRLLIGDTTKLGMPKPDHRVLESHPLVNDQLLSHLRHGDVRLVADVERVDGGQVVLKDGERLDVDLVLLATGYTRSIPYLDAEHLDGSWAAGQALTAFSRRYDSLFTLGFAEINGALFPHLSRLSALIAEVARAELAEPEVAARFFSWLRKTTFDLQGGRRLIATKRHEHYTDEHALESATQRAFRKMGWKIPQEA
jgi:hypothetical protein